jgi:hypothetical protein
MSSPLTPILVVGVVAWSFYRRIRRNIGRQPLRPRRIGFSIGAFSLASILMLLASAIHLPSLFSLIGGLLLGVVLGAFGLHLTRFETTDDGHFYTPSTHIGIALSALLFGRLAYRFWVFQDLANVANHPPPMQSPLTYFIFGLLAGYYLTFYIGLFMHTHDKKSPA